MEYISTSIQEIQFKSGFPETIEIINTLGVFNYVDDLKGNCIINWFLGNNEKNLVWNSYTLTQEEYDSWDSSPLGLLQILAKVLNVQII